MIRPAFWAAVTVLSLLSAEPLFAQDPEFSQFYANRIYLNPAYAGTENCPRVMMSYRDQWPGISGTYMTAHFSYDQYVNALSGGLAISVMSDQAGAGGILKTTWVSGIYAYKFNVNRFFAISSGFQATWAQKSVDWSKLTFGDMIDPRRGFVYTTDELNHVDQHSYLDISVGLTGYSDHYYFGVAVNHLTQPDESLISGPSPLPRKITINAGALLPVDADKSNHLYISPNVLYQKQQDFHQLNLGFYLKNAPFVMGLWYRNTDAIIVLIGFENKYFKTGYSYDITISKLTNVTAGAHEFSLTKIFSCKPVKKIHRMDICPSF